MAASSSSATSHTSDSSSSSSRHRRRRRSRRDKDRDALRIRKKSRSHTKRRRKHRHSSDSFSSSDSESEYSRSDSSESEPETSNRSKRHKKNDRTKKNKERDRSKSHHHKRRKHKAKEMENSNESARKDPTWKYAHSGNYENPKDVPTFVCKFCLKTSKGGVYRVKQHLVGGFRNFIACKKCSDEVKEEIRQHMLKKKEVKEIRNLDQGMYEVDDVDLEFDEEDFGEGFVNNLNKRISSQSSLRGGDESIQSSAKKSRANGPMDHFYALNSEKIVEDQRKEKGKQTTMDVYKKEMRERVCQKIGRWFYDSGIPLNACNYDSFGLMVEAVGQYGVGLKPPSYHELREPILKKELKLTNQMLKSLKEEWVKVGCTIMADECTDRRERTVINFLVNSPKGTIFIESIDASYYAKTGEKLFELLDKFVDRIGEANVVQVVTNSASANVLTGRLLEVKRPHLFWSPCAAHCLDLMLEDIFKIPSLKRMHKRAVELNSYMYSHPELLNLMNRSTNKRELLGPGTTRFVTACITLLSIHRQKNNLKKMFTSDEWKNSKWSKEPKGKRIVQTVLIPNFWSTIVLALKFSCPLVRVLRLVDGDKKPPMGYIYNAMNKAKEAIAKAFDMKEDKYREVFEIIDRRWELLLHHPLHAAGYYLNPEFFYSNFDIEQDGEIIKGLHACIARLVPSLELQDKICEEMSKYKMVKGFLDNQWPLDKDLNYLQLNGGVFMVPKLQT